ncbi:MAG TPA: LuxR C-terminal-related transcriptional regulator, partial [Chloroflexota bacterium]|nr:LuxR C-terminal-related transcriptional regulator [Chloroflexota bacterium]
MYKGSVLMTMTAVATRVETDAILTDRQIEILSLLLEGKSSKEVARMLYVSKR